MCVTDIYRSKRRCSLSSMCSCYHQSSMHVVLQIVLHVLVITKAQSALFSKLRYSTETEDTVIHASLSPWFFDWLSQALLCPTPGFLRRQTEVDMPQLVLKSMCMLSRVQLFTVPWTVVCQAKSIYGIPQVRLLEWVAISYSRGSS